MAFLRMTETAHQLLKERIQAGDTVVDATAGNGHDTLFLAKLVGETGTVHAYDIQEQALMNTREKLEVHHLSSRVTLHHASHTELIKLGKPLKAVVFNLGYLPGSDKRVITQPETTVQAVKAAVSLLQPGGIVVIVVYRGHEGGEEEAYALEQFVRQLSSLQYIVLKYEYINQYNSPPYIVAIERKQS